MSTGLSRSMYPSFSKPAPQYYNPEVHIAWKEFDMLLRERQMHLDTAEHWLDMFDEHQYCMFYENARFHFNKFLDIGDMLYRTYKN